MRPASERLGLFSEPKYVTVGDKYKSVNPNKPFNEGAYKKKQMMTTVTKSKINGSTDGYLDPSYKRIFSGEALNDPMKQRRKEEKAARKKNITTKVFAPASPPKRPSGAGSHIGTFSGTIKYVDPKQKPQRKPEKEKRNFTTTPGKKGSGFGYVDVTIGEFPKYKSSPFEADKAKERALAKAAKKKMISQAPFKLNGPDGGGVFTKDPYKSSKPLPPAKKTNAPVKKITVPFYPTKPPPSMAAKNLGTLNRYPYMAEKTAKKEKKKPPLKGEWKPTAPAKGMVTKSVLSMGVQRSFRSSVMAS